MAGSYEFWLTDDKGMRLADSQGRTLLDKILTGRFQRIANGEGRFSARFPVSFDTTLLKPDRMLQVWRQPERGSLGLWRVYFIRRWEFSRLGSELLISMAGADANSLLSRRIVANYAQTIESEKRDTADDMMKEIVDEQMVTDASNPAPSYGTRAVPSFTVEASVGQGPTLSKGFAWWKVARVIGDLQRASWGAGTEVFWDVIESDISSSSIAFQFRTKTGQPGADRTGSAVFDEARGNLEAATLVYDYTEEENYIYGLGQGEDEFRYVAQAYDATRINLSQYGRIEGIAPPSQAASPEDVDAAANARLMERRPVRTLTAQAMDTDGSTFGRDWNWGDRVTARFLGQEFEAIIRQVEISLSGNGRETIDAPIEAVEFI